MSPTNKTQVLRMHLLVCCYLDVEHEVKRVVEGCFGPYGEYTYTLSKFESNIDYLHERKLSGMQGFIPTSTTYSVQATAKWIPA